MYRSLVSLKDVFLGPIDNLGVDFAFFIYRRSY